MTGTHWPRCAGRLEANRGAISPPTRSGCCCGRRQDRLDKTLANDDGGLRSRQRVAAAEQSLLAARLAADSGARRGELGALQLGDLDGQVLTIARGASMDQIGTTKTRRINRLTLGATTAALWRDLAWA